MTSATYWRIGVPSLGNERIYCPTCLEYTIRKNGVCVRTGCGEKVAEARYRRIAPMRRNRNGKGPVRLCDPVTGLERKG